MKSVRRRDTRRGSEQTRRPAQQGDSARAPRGCCRTYCPGCPWTTAQLARERGRTPPKPRKGR